MDLAAELKKRLDYRQKVVDELSALDQELNAVVGLLQSEAVQNQTPPPMNGAAHVGPDAMLPEAQPTQIIRRRPRVGDVSADMIEQFLSKKVDKAIDVHDLVTRFGMKPNSATTRLWNLAKAGRIVKTGPGIYYVPGRRDAMSQTG